LRQRARARSGGKGSLEIPARSLREQKAKARKTCTEKGGKSGVIRITGNTTVRWFVFLNEGRPGNGMESSSPWMFLKTLERGERDRVRPG